MSEKVYTGQYANLNCTKPWLRFLTSYIPDRKWKTYGRAVGESGLRKLRRNFLRIKQEMENEEHLFAYKIVPETDQSINEQVLRKNEIYRSIEKRRVPVYVSVA